jgi:cell division septum initiation protein DivIVA
MRDKYEKVAKECDRIKKENEKLKAELKGLDFVSMVYCLCYITQQRKEQI